MGRIDKTIDRLLRGNSDSNFAFRDLCWLLKKLGFQERVKGSYHIFSHDSLAEVINLQPKKAKAKDYQVRQVREILTEYGLIRVVDSEAPTLDEESNPEESGSRTSRETDNGDDNSSL